MCTSNHIIIMLIIFILPFRCRLEIQNRAKFELEHIMNMLRVILAEKQSKPGELNQDFFLRDDFVGPRFYDYLLDVFNDYERLNFLS